MTVPVGIDLGTTRCRVGVWRGNHVEIFENEFGSTSTPAFVSYSSGEILVGESAKNRAFRNARNTVFNTKRLIGCDDAGARRASERQALPYKVVSRSGVPQIAVEELGQERLLTPESIIAEILNYLKDVAAQKLGSPPTEAVITVPGFFDGFQKKATILAAGLVGLKVLRLIPEPNAAMLAYCHKKQVPETRVVFLLDLGGGSSQAGVFNLDLGVIETRALLGYGDLGGEDYDAKLVEFCSNEFRRKDRRELAGNPRAHRRLRNACEAAKRALSIGSQAVVEVDALADDIDFRICITRSQFEELCEPEFQRVIRLVENTLTEAKLTKDQVDDIVMVGGSSRIPRIVSLVRDYFGKDIDKGLHADEAPVYGAASFAAMLSGSTAPIHLESLLCDCYPNALGVECKGGVMSVIHKKYGAIPSKRSQYFTTTIDNQPIAFIPIYEGQNTQHVQDNRLLGSVKLVGLPPAPRGVVMIEVTIEIESSGEVKVQARDKVSSKEVTLEVSFKLGDPSLRPDPYNSAYLLEPSEPPKYPPAASEPNASSTTAPPPQAAQPPPPPPADPPNAQGNSRPPPNQFADQFNQYSGIPQPGGPGQSQQSRLQWGPPPTSPPFSFGQTPNIPPFAFGQSPPPPPPPNVPPTTPWGQSAPQPPPPPPNPQSWWSSPQPPPVSSTQWGHPPAPSAGQWGTPNAVPQPQLPPRPEIEARLRDMEEMYRTLERSHAALDAKCRGLESQNAAMEVKLANLEAVVYGRRQY